MLANVISSQAQVHAPYGGVVPEVASRRHLELIVPVVEQALAEAGVTLADLDAVAVTEGPGLIGALLVGLSAAKAIAFARGLPLVPVNHLHGHLAALYLQPEPVEPPFLALLASGGHTLILDVTDHARLPLHRRHARRRRRRGVRQGRAPARPRLSRAAPAGAARGRRRPAPRTPSRRACWAGPATTSPSAG